MTHDQILNSTYYKCSLFPSNWDPKKEEVIFSIALIIESNISVILIVQVCETQPIIAMLVPYCFQFPFPVHKPAAYDLVACMQTSRKTSSLQARGCLATRSSCSLVSQVNSRRSANYHPTIWEHDLIETMCSPYSVS